MTGFFIFAPLEGAKFMETGAGHSGTRAVTFFNTVNQWALNLFSSEKSLGIDFFVKKKITGHEVIFNRKITGEQLFNSLY